MLGRKRMCREGCIPGTNRCLNSTVHPHTGSTAREHRGGEIGLSQGRLGQQLGKLGGHVEEDKMKDKSEKAVQTTQSKKPGSEKKWAETKAIWDSGAFIKP